MNKPDTFSTKFTGPGPDQGRFERNEGKKPGLFCSYCKRIGHVMDKCYRLHGFSPSSRFKGAEGQLLWFKQVLMIFSLILMILFHTTPLWFQV